MNSVVYFIQSADGLVKIGWTADLARRLNNLNSASSSPLRVLATTPGGATLEAHLHERFSDLRERGEWFRPNDDLLRLVGQILEGRADIFAAGLVGADSAEYESPTYAGSKSEQAAIFARRLVDLGVQQGLSVKESIAQVTSRLHVPLGTFTALLYRSPSSVDVDLYYSIRALLSDDLIRQLRTFENELLAVRKAREMPFSEEDLEFFDLEISRLRKRIAAFREDNDA